MELEVSECSGATRMDDSLGNALMIETMNLGCDSFNLWF